MSLGSLVFWAWEAWLWLLMEFDSIGSCVLIGILFSPCWICGNFFRGFAKRSCWWFDFFFVWLWICDYLRIYVKDHLIFWFLLLILNHCLITLFLMKFIYLGFEFSLWDFLFLLQLYFNKLVLSLGVVDVLRISCLLILGGMIMMGNRIWWVVTAIKEWQNICIWIKYFF